MSLTDLLPKFITVDTYSSEPVFFCLSNLLFISPLILK